MSLITCSSSMALSSAAISLTLLSWSSRTVAITVSDTPSRQPSAHRPTAGGRHPPACARAVLLLHQRRVDKIVPKLSAAELEQVIDRRAISTRLSARHARRTQAAESFGIAGAATAVGREHSQ